MGHPASTRKSFISLVAALLPSFVRRNISRVLFRARRWRDEFCDIDIYETKSFSQEGEDMILNRIFCGKEQGFYIDVGAHHPRRFSNTYAFYRRGWRGINIEPNPDAAAEFNRERGRDANLQIGISKQPGKLEYYKFDESALNTFDGDLARKRLESTSYTILEIVEVPLERLDHVLDMHVPANTEIDFLSVDVEGLDLSVLKSNNWNVFRPKIVLAEELGTSIADAVKGSISLFMREQGYELFAKTFNTLFFRDAKMDAGSWF